MRMPELLLIYTALAVCWAAEVDGNDEGVGDGGPQDQGQDQDQEKDQERDQEVSETGHRRARMWRKMFKSLFAHGHNLAYPAAYLLGNYAKHLGHGHHHHNKGHSDPGFPGLGLGHHASSYHWGGSPLQHWHGNPHITSLSDHYPYGDHTGE